MKKLFFSALALAALAGVAQGNTISESQKKFIKQYEKQKGIPKPEEMLINTDPEPDTCCGFTSLYNGKDLSGWTSLGGNCTFEPKGDVIIGTTIPGSPSTYLSTDKADYKDFIFTAELMWEVNGNSGVMIRGQQRPGKDNVTVFGPQAEMEGYDTGRGRHWSGGIYGQAAGGWLYPLWLEAHKEVRGALKEGEFNRITVQVIGDTYKTWLNGVPAAHWKNSDYEQGFFSLQVHSGKAGEIHFRNIKVKEL